MNASVNDEIRYKLLKLLKDQPTLTQREMNQQMGVSLGKINFCISALAEKGMIRIERFKNNSNKAAYIYRLTPSGFKELTRLTYSYLHLKLAEYDQIKKEIKSLADQLSQMDSESSNALELMRELRKIN